MVVRVVCVGNSLAKDDGLGMYVARILETCRLPAHVVLERRPSLGFELLDLLEQGAQRLIIVDALHGAAAPGRCVAMDVDAAAGLAGRPCCAHALGLAEVLQIAARLPATTIPDRITILGIEAVDLEGWGTALSEPVRAALPELMTMLVEQMGGDEALAAQAVAAAQAIEPLALAEALGVGAASRPG